jgi:hypothetical protein
MKLRREWPAIALFSARSRALARLASALVLALVAALGCETSSDLSLLEVHAFEIDEDAALLYVLGNGFVTDARCEVLLEGTEYPRGFVARAARLSAACRVLTDGRAVVDLSQPVLSTRRRAWFEGRLTIRLSAAQAARTVSGATEAVRLRLGPRGSAALVDEALAEARASTRFQRSVGIRGVEASTRGLLVTALDDDAPYARAGGSVGDALRRINGAPVEEAADLLPPQGAAEARFDVVRRGVGSMAVHVPLGGTPPLDPQLWLLAALLTFAMAFMLRTPSTPITVPLSRASLWFGLSFCAVLLSQLLFHELDAGLTWLLPFGVHGAFSWLSYTRGRAQGVRLAEAALDKAVATLCVAALALSVGTLRTPLFGGADDVAEPTLALATPSGFLAALGLWLTLRPRARDQDTPTALLLRSSAAWIVAALGLGAGALPRVADAVRSTPLSLALFVLEAGLVLYLLSETTRLPSGLGRVLALALSALSIAVTWLLPSAAMHVPSELVLACAVGFCLGHLARTLWSRVRARRTPLRDPALHPFL